LIRRLLLDVTKKVFATRGYILLRDWTKSTECGPLPLPLWLDDAKFVALYNEIKSDTMVDMIRCFMLYQLSRCVSLLDGDVAEVGVWRGGTGKLLAKSLPQKAIYLFDTFEGLPRTTPEYDRDYYTEGMLADTSYEHVRSSLQSCPNAHVVKGIFPESARDLEMPQKFAFAHVDVDLYESTLNCCSFFWDRFVPGGIMVVDDYGFGTCPGVRHAIDQFFADRPERPVYLTTGQCVVTKLAPSFSGKTGSS
jgi:O-methyltransferase